MTGTSPSTGTRSTPLTVVSASTTAVSDSPPWVNVITSRGGNSDSSVTSARLPSASINLSLT